MNQKALATLKDQTLAQMRSRVSFGRFELAKIEGILGADTIAGWVGTEIGDKTLRSIAEDSVRLAKVSFVGAKTLLLLATLTRESGSRIGVWEVQVAKDRDTWERQVNEQVTARGSLKTLRAAIGKHGIAQFGVMADVIKLAEKLKIDRQTASLAGYVAKAAKTEAKDSKSAKTATKRRKSNAKDTEDDEGGDE